MYWRYIGDVLEMYWRYACEEYEKNQRKTGASIGNLESTLLEFLYEVIYTLKFAGDVNLLGAVRYALTA